MTEKTNLQALGSTAELGWNVTSDLQTALANNYIGEVQIAPRPVADRLNFAATGRRLPRWTMYYYGRPDERLRELFGYAPPNAIR